LRKKAILKPHLKIKVMYNKSDILYQSGMNYLNYTPR
jgi:hypothetical protein